MRVRRVGTVTLGVTMIGIGVLFLAGMVFPGIPFDIVFQAWPIIFIILGGEILWSNHKEKNGDEERAFIYDKMAILLVVVLTVFAMFLSVISHAVQLSVQF